MHCFQRFLFSNQLWRLPLKDKLQLGVTSVPSLRAVCQGGSPFPRLATGPSCKLHDLLRGRISYGPPTVPCSVDGLRMSLGTRESSKASSPSENGGQGFPGGQSSSRTPNRTLPFVDFAKSRAVIICSHLLVAKSYQFDLPSIFPVCPFVCNTSTADLVQDLSRWEHGSSRLLVSRISPSRLSSIRGQCDASKRP